MWNNFSPYTSVSSPGPSRSTGFFNRSDSTSSYLRDSPPRSSLRDSSSFSRSNSIRDSSLASSQFQRRSDTRRSDTGPTRVSRDSETTGLLERYGVRRGSATESPVQALLKQRKQSEPDGGLFTRGTVRDAAPTYALGPSTSSRGHGAEANGSAWTQSTAAGQMQNLSQQDYMNRLMAAHSRVDELLRSRGLNSDDENKYLRAWEQIPVIREERFRRLRSPSNSSDSGLSTDNDSDRSNAESAVPEENVELKEKFELVEDDVCTFDVFHLKSSINEAVSFSIKAPEQPVVSKSVAVQLIQKEQQETTVVISPLVNSTSSEAQFKEVKQPSTRWSPPLEANISRNLSFVKKSCQHACDKIWKTARKQKITETLAVPLSNEIEKSFNFRRRQIVDPGTTEQRRQVLSSIKRKSAPPIPSTAEISIQHCSFYQIKQNAVAALPEKNVRINLRLTERAPKNCAASIVLPAPPRVAYVRLDIPAELPRMRRTMSTQLVPQQKHRMVGKLDRGFTVDLAEVPREPRKVNRLRIPEYFLQQSAEAQEDVNGVRNNLKKVSPAAIIGGFVYELKPQPQSGLRRAGAIRRRAPPTKSTLTKIPGAEPFADFLPTEPPDPPYPPSEKLCHLQETGHLNLPGSLDRPATSSGASTLKESSIAELSETDRRLVEQFRRSLNIPRPQTIVRRALSPLTIRCFYQETPEKKPPHTTWIRRKSPVPKETSKVRSPSPLCLKRVFRSSQKVTKYIFGEWTVSLKRVDKSVPLRSKPKRRRLPRWIPRWRKKHRSDEEVEEVEEEEVVEEEIEEEEVTKAAVPSEEPRHERVISKSYNDDEVEGLTEGEKAMAAAKRRHEEEQQAKLLDYEEKRRTEREKEEEELRRLKEKQEKRRLEREQEEREMLERRQQEDERRRREEEERKQRGEDEKRKKEESNRKKNQISGGAFTSLVNTAGPGGRNFTIPKKSETMGDKFGNIVQAKQEMGMTKDQQEQAKKIFLAQVARGLAEASGLPQADLKNKIKELHQRICKLEADKYDLEKRHERQEYDLKELNERQRQVARNSALKKGLDPTEAGSSRYPPRVRVVSKYETNSEALSFHDKRSVFLSQSKRDQSPELSKGSARPPAEWGRKIVHEDIEAYLKNPDRCPKYVEKGENDSTDTRRSPPMAVRPLIIPKIFAN